jgi:hypothetical protein
MFKLFKGFNVLKFSKYITYYYIYIYIFFFRGGVFLWVLGVVGA